MRMTSPALPDGSQLAAMAIDNGTTVKTLKFYYDAKGRPMCLDYNGAMYFYITNLQGDVVALADQYGEVIRYEYDAWGKPIVSEYYVSSHSDAMQNNPLRYRGYIYDAETGFYYLQSRYYDPIIGRFINSDGQLNGGFLGYNMFAYCETNPVIFVDDIGQRPQPILGLLEYYIVHKMVQSDCVSKNADLYTEVYVLSNEGKRGYLDLYDLKIVTILKYAFVDYIAPANLQTYMIIVSIVVASIRVLRCCSVISMAVCFYFSQKRRVKI